MALKRLRVISRQPKLTQSQGKLGPHNFLHRKPERALPKVATASAFRIRGCVEAHDLADAYDGPGKDGGRNFSLQTYSYTVAFIQLVDSLDGNYSYDNFHATAEALADNPIVLPSIPPASCGPLPGGHSCAAGAGLAQYNAADDPDGDGVGTWVQIRDFQAPAS